MNVQQINQSGQSILSFVYTSIVLLVLSALSFFLRHYMRHVFVGSVVAMRRIFYDNLVPFVKRKIKWVLRMWHGPHGPPRIQRMVRFSVVKFCRFYIDKIQQH
jgi:hypothetical protein